MSAFDGWIPLGFAWDGPVPKVDWCYLGQVRYTDPFFEDTMQRAMEHPYRVLFRRTTPVDVLEERAATHPGLPPSGFIFHMSRCGSTLCSRMLAASNRNIVISEGWPVDAVIRAGIRRPGITWEQRRSWLRGVIHALGQPRAGSECRYFIKFDATHALDLPLVRSAFPEVPWVFLYRDPVEVMVSQFRRRAAWTLPGIFQIEGIPLTPSAFVNPEEYVADLLAAICESALRAAGAHNGLFLNYRELPGAVYGKLSVHFGCEWEPSELAAMRAATTRDAKQPERPFAPDSERKQSEASALIRELCDRKLGSAYRRLEAIPARS